MKIKNLSRLQKKVLDACMDGWFMSGEYTAMFDNHRRSFEADSPLWLYRDIERWYASHAANHGDSHLLVMLHQGRLGATCPGTPVPSGEMTKCTLASRTPRGLFC